ncbi:hypothetical protein BM477_00535 [Boudabousia marimammalium]|uniref:Energy-coupling factor transporter transmembrane protein EcfT n=1 Tax=Boudabousia marimammalium TaxID=156892 RepID=A0A1Q5PSV2_9ACTO|nr:hypothetical protein BM477_00535 [Boudabousia marimammalium]
MTASNVDPRTKLLFLVVVNTTLMHAAKAPEILVGMLVAGFLLVVSDGWRSLRPYLLIMLPAAFCAYVLPLLWQNVLVAIFVTIGYWTLRFGVSISAAIYVILTTGPAQLTAALRRLRIPQFIVIPFTVVLRYIPTVIDELFAIRDAMRLRGLFPGAFGVLAHPIRTAEYILVPLLSSSIRMADELSAAALTRGLGGAVQPTSIVRLRFTWHDAALIAATAAIAFASTIWGWLL